MDAAVLAARNNWRVSYTYIPTVNICDYNRPDVYSINTGPVRERSGRIIKAQKKGWKDETMDEEIIEQMLDENIIDSSVVNERANHIIIRACGAAMVRRRSTSTRRPVYW